MKTVYKFIPLFIIIGLLAAYIWSNNNLVNCESGNCRKIESRNLSEIPAAANVDINARWKNSNSVDCLEKPSLAANSNSAAKINDLSCVETLINAKKAELAEKEKNLQAVQDVIDRLDGDIRQNRVAQIEKAKTAAPAPSPAVEAANSNTNSNTATGASTNNQTLEQKEKWLALQKTLFDQDKTVAEKERDKTVGEIKDIRGRVGERYSKRMIFMFMTAAFVLLCIASILFSIYVIGATVAGKKLRNVWQGVTTICAVGFFLLVWLGSDEKYLSIVKPLFSQSITTNGDVSFDLIHLVNCIGFAATIWVVSAANAIFYRVMTERETVENDRKDLENYQMLTATLAGQLAVETDENKLAQAQIYFDEAQKQMIAKMIYIKNKFKIYKDRITVILYLGAVMLFVGILRTKLLADWHILFVEGSFKDILKSFFESSISVQAGFYSIILAVVFVPVIYAIPEADIPETQAGDTTPKKNLLERLGLPFSSGFITKLLAVLLPLFGQQAVELLGYIIGRTN